MDNNTDTTEQTPQINYVFHTCVESAYIDYFKLENISGRFCVKNDFVTGDKVTMYITRSEPTQGVIK